MSSCFKKCQQRVTRSGWIPSSSCEDISFFRRIFRTPKPKNPRSLKHSMLLHSKGIVKEVLVKNIFMKQPQSHLPSHAFLLQRLLFISWVQGSQSLKVLGKKSFFPPQRKTQLHNFQLDAKCKTDAMDQSFYRKPDLTLKLKGPSITPKGKTVQISDVCWSHTFMFWIENSTEFPLKTYYHFVCLFVFNLVCAIWNGWLLAFNTATWNMPEFLRLQAFDNNDPLIMRIRFKIFLFFMYLADLVWKALAEITKSCFKCIYMVHNKICDISKQIFSADYFCSAWCHIIAHTSVLSFLFEKAELLLI